MFAQTFGAAIVGLNGLLITVEVDTANGLPSIDLVGLPDAAVREAKERVRAAIKNSKFDFPQKRVTINLAPAHIRKDNSGLDLPIALAILVASGQLPAENLKSCLFCAELSLDGRLRSVSGVLPMVLGAREQGITEVFVSPENANEALLVGKMRVYSAETLADVAAHWSGEKKLLPHDLVVDRGQDQGASSTDFSEIFGQVFAKRGLEIAAAGGHNLLMVGPPGSGKTLLARSLPSILPPLSEDEALEVTKIYSVTGLLGSDDGMIQLRPFRSPHNTISPIGLIGGGARPKPGEVTLSHHGVLFLDELPEFSRSALEVLRQPLEDGEVSITRSQLSVKFPSSFILVGSMNPCPCGPKHECTCTPQEIRRYQKRISGPLLDRIDLHVQVPKLEYHEIETPQKCETSAQVRARVEQARARQRERLKSWQLYYNAQMGRTVIRQTCRFDAAAQRILKQAFEKLQLSGRAYDRLLKVSRTIADLEESDIITGQHVAEAAQFRNSFLQF